MSALRTLLDGNQRFASTFADSELPIKPRLGTIVLTCVDTRLDPARFLDVAPGDILVLRNTGGRLTQGVLLDLAVLGFLASGPLGGPPVSPELVIIHHTDCGMSRLVDPEAQRALGERLGISSEAVAAMAIADPAESVKDDVEKFLHTPGVPATFVVSGHVYDVATGLLDEVVAPSSPPAG
ncbi:MAG: carbonic anhydrase [Acidobacteria bacterium]|nr:carbonic anhydrase [Acidobacteriota bacterium]